MKTISMGHTWEVQKVNYVLMDASCRPIFVKLAENADQDTNAR